MLVSLSTPAIPGIYTNPVKAPSDYAAGFEMGSLAIQNPAGGLLQQLWTVSTDGFNIFISAPNQPRFVLLTDAFITEVDLAFDQNMFPFVTYVSEGLMKFYWFDPVAGQFVVSTILTLGFNPRCTLDDKRAFDVGNSDIILAYINALTGQLCYRIQRERYATEHSLYAVAPNIRLQCVNAATGGGDPNEADLRLQFTLNDYTPQITQNVHNGLVNHTRPISITGAYIT